MKSVITILFISAIIYLSYADVAPMLQSMWGTDDSWNNSCPRDNAGDGRNVNVGTMAVSTSMIMKYWNHPANGEGTNSYDDAPYGTITADFENTHYNWAAMSNTLILTGTQQLLFHSGVAMNMDYGTFESYAPISNAFSALVNNFRYDATAQLVSRQDYTDAAWEQLLKNELNNARPILYKADTANGEIGFVIDGWQNGNEFHVNWGDEGNENGYFTLDALAFNGIDMTAGNAAVIGIYPSLGPVTVDENFEGDFSGFNWQFSGDSDWNITTNEHFYGVQAAKSGQINHNQSTSLFIEIDVSVDDVISFNQRVSCENSQGTPSYDYLSFWIDDQEMDRWDGDAYWEYEEYPVTAGVHTFRWTYQKDGATIEGQDCAWIDAVDFPNGDTPLNPVENFNVQVVNGNSALLSWQQPSLTLRNLIGYRVYRNGSELITVSNPNVLSYTDTNLPNAEYTYYVKAFYQEGLSNPSNPITIEIEVPYAPTNLIAEVVSDDDIHLSWSRPPTFRNRALSGYRIYRNDVVIADITNPLTITYDDMDLAQAVYRYVVKAVYTIGESAPSNVAIAAIGVPIPPTGLTAQIVNGNDVQLNWNAPAGTREFLGYKVYRNSVMIMQIDNPSTLTYTDMDLSNGSYTYEVTGLYSNGESESATSASVVIEVLYAPTNVSYQIENQINVRLTWANPTTTRNLISYSVYRDGQQIAAIFNPNRLYYLDEDLANGVYNYYVTATYTSGTSAPSQSVSVLMEVLYPCTLVTGNVVGDDITLNWNLPAISGGLRSFNGYNIY
ncbi:MAG: C10 family peptidase, partial [Candidatus Cloacimonetes bacterium]|nr:C10 family peptidase [Candidatus Cloacimonadota bacterium]